MSSTQQLLDNARRMFPNDGLLHIFIKQGDLKTVEGILEEDIQQFGAASRDRSNGDKDSRAKASKHKEDAERLLREIRGQP